MSKSKSWYTMKFYGTASTAFDALKEVLEDEEDVQYNQLRRGTIQFLSDKSWSELREELDAIAVIGVCTQRNKLEHRSTI